MAFTPPALGGVDTDRFGYKNNRGMVWLPDIADTSGLVPTEAEINAGTDFTCSVQAISGFAISPRYAELQDLCSDVDGKVFDGASLDDSAITFYLAQDEDDAMGFFTKGDQGFVLDCPYGFAGLKRAWVWKSEVSAVTPTVATSGGAMGTVAYAITAVRQITLPAET